MSLNLKAPSSRRGTSDALQHRTGSSASAHNSSGTEAGDLYTRAPNPRTELAWNAPSILAADKATVAKGRLTLQRVSDGRSIDFSELKALLEASSKGHLEFHPRNYALSELVGPSTDPEDHALQIYDLMDTAAEILSYWPEEGWNYVLPVRDEADRIQRSEGKLEPLASFVETVDTIMMDAALAGNSTAIKALIERTFVRQSIGSKRRAMELYSSLPELRRSNPQFVTELRRYFEGRSHGSDVFDFDNAIGAYYAFDPTNGHSKIEHEEIGAIPITFELISRLFDDDGNEMGDTARLGLTMLMISDCRSAGMYQSILAYLEEMVERRGDEYHIDAIKRWLVTGTLPFSGIGLPEENDWYDTCALFAGIVNREETHRTFAEFIQGGEEVIVREGGEMTSRHFDLDFYLRKRYVIPSDWLPKDPPQYELMRFFHTVKGLFKRGYMNELVSLIGRASRVFQKNAALASDEAYSKLSQFHRGAINYCLDDPQMQELLAPYAFSEEPDETFFAFDIIYAIEPEKHPRIFEEIEGEDLPAIDRRFAVGWRGEDSPSRYDDKKSGLMVIHKLIKSGWEGRIPFWERVLNSYMDRPELFDFFTELFRFDLEYTLVNLLPKNFTKSYPCDHEAYEIIERGALDPFIVGKVTEEKVEEMREKVDMVVALRGLWESLDLRSLLEGKTNVYKMSELAINDTLPLLFEEDMVRHPHMNGHHLVDAVASVCEVDSEYGRRCVEELGRPLIEAIKRVALREENIFRARQHPELLKEMLVDPLARDVVEALMEITTDAPLSTLDALHELVSLEVMERRNLQSLATDESELKVEIRDFLRKLDRQTFVNAYDDERGIWVHVMRRLVELDVQIVDAETKELIGSPGD